MTKTRRIQFVSWGNNLIRYLLDKIPFDGAQIPNFGQLLMIKLKGSQKHQTTVHFCTGKSRFSFIYAENFGSLFWRGARQRIHWSNGGNKETHCSSTNWYKHRENNWDFFCSFVHPFLLLVGHTVCWDCSSSQFCLAFFSYSTWGFFIDQPKKLIRIVFLQ